LPTAQALQKIYLGIFFFLPETSACATDTGSCYKPPTYRLFKDNFEFEDYLTMTANQRQRRIITKFRISAHKLEIEHGRYFNVAMEHRICKLCKLDIENEIHFLLECPVLETSRHDIIKGT
jgi:hypothetical protein